MHALVALLIAHVTAGTEVELAGAPAQAIDRELTFPVTRATRRWVRGEVCSFTLCLELRVARADLAPIVVDDAVLDGAIYVRAGTAVTDGEIVDPWLGLRVPIDPDLVGDLARSTIDRVPPYAALERGDEVTLAAGTAIRDDRGDVIATPPLDQLASRIADHRVLVFGRDAVVIGTADAVSEIAAPAAAEVAIGGTFATPSPDLPQIPADTVLHRRRGGRRVGVTHQALSAERLRRRGRWTAWRIDELGAKVIVWTRR